MSFRFIDLFAGCGGLSLGLSQIGGTGILAVEKNEDAFLTLSKNLCESNSHTRSFEWVEGIAKSAHDIQVLLNEKKVELAALKGSVDLLVGGPPCQGFSTYGKRAPNDARNLLYRKYLEFVALTEPAAIVLENVEGINMPFIQKRASTGRQCKETTAYRIQKELRAIGYESIALRLCASDFGVPQSRPRFFLIGIKNGSRSLLDQHSNDQFLQDFRADFLKTLGLRSSARITVRQALSDLETVGAPLIDCPDSKKFLQAGYQGPRTNYQRQMHEGLANTIAPNSMRLARHAEKTVEKFQFIHSAATPGYNVARQLKGSLDTVKHRIHLLNANATSPTITTLPDDFIHYSEPRILTVRECARLQSFPDWFEFHGKYTSGGNRRKLDCPRFTQVGNAVPPRLASFLGIYIQELLRVHRAGLALRIAA